MKFSQGEMGISVKDIKNLMWRMIEGSILILEREFHDNHTLKNYCFYLRRRCTVFINNIGGHSYESQPLT
jgi:hypothetical protein